jgi:cation transport ATPase
MFSKNSFIILVKSKWHEITAVASLIAMLLHFILKFFVVEVDGEQIALVATENFPLIFLIFVGGIPLVLQIVFKAFKGDLGADLLALIGLITAIFLDEYLASALIILMLSSGQALEIYASRRASFVLEALAKRMPATAHRKVGSRTADISILEIKIGDLIEIYPHEICPIDGEVVSG